MFPILMAGVADIEGNPKHAASIDRRFRGSKSSATLNRSNFLTNTNINASWRRCSLTWTKPSLKLRGPKGGR